MRSLLYLFPRRIAIVALIGIVMLKSSGALGSTIFQKTYPELPINQQNPDSSWGAAYSKLISTRVINSQNVLVVAMRVTTVNSEAGAGPFSDVSQTYLADYNGDGRADIIAVTYGGRVVIKRNDGVLNNTPTFTDTISYSIYNLGNNNGVGDGTAVVDDFDRDGRLDLFLFNARQLAIFIPNALQANPTVRETQFYTSDVRFRTNWTVSAMVSYDFDNDGFKDIIYADMSGRVWLWRNVPSSGNRRFFAQNNLQLLLNDPDIGTTSSYGGAVLDLSDVDDDGVPDLVVGNTDKRNIFIYPGRVVNQRLTFNVSEKIPLVLPDGNLSSFVVVDTSIPNSKTPKDLPSFAPTVIKVIDVDRDGLKDVFVATDAWRQGANYGGSIYLFKGRERTADGKTRFLSLELVRGNYSSSGLNPYDFDSGAVGDIDNDGIPDFVAADGNHSGNYYRIMLRTSEIFVDEPTFLLSFESPRLVGIPLAELRNYFTKRIEVTIRFFSSPSSDGFYSLRFSRIKVADPRYIDLRNFPLFPGVEEWNPIPPTRQVTATVEFDKPTPDPQVIIALRRRSETVAPQIVQITYRVWTMPASVQIKKLQWTRGK